MPNKNDGGPAFPRNGHPDKNDLPIDGMSLRVYTAIELKQPDSGIDWLDKMIIDAKRDYFAAKAMQAMATEYDKRPDIYDIVICEKAYKIADAMLKAREE